MIFGVEFLSLLIFMVYIGAIAVLFLFVVMMLNIKIVELRTTYLRYLPVGIFIVIIFFELVGSIFIKFDFIVFNLFDFVSLIDKINFDGNIYIIGFIIYTFFCHYFILIGLILFVSMLGSIVLVINYNYNNVVSYNN